LPNVAFFVDLPNFYGSLLKTRIETPEFLRKYFAEGLDFDLLAQSLIDGSADIITGIWVFLNGDKLGPSTARIDQNYLKTYIGRINILEAVTARDVNIPGEQRESAEYMCEICGHKGIAVALSEKGVDTSLIVHLFDTMDSWDRAFLLSGDADFVPAVTSLRRRGKTVTGVGFPMASTALVRECYSYINVREAYLEEDIFLFSIFKQDGIAYQWLTDEIILLGNTAPPPKIDVRVSWLQLGHPTKPDLSDWVPENPTAYRVSFNVNNEIDFTSRDLLFANLNNKFPKKGIKHEDGNTNRCLHWFSINQFGFESMKKRLALLHSTAVGSELRYSSKTNGSLHMVYQFDEATNAYKLVSN